MPLKSYGVLVARALEAPHYQIRLADEAGRTYRAAVNVRSQKSPSELLHLVDDDLHHLQREGWTVTF